MFKKYLETVAKVFFQPILFYTELPPGEIKDEPVAFCSITSWILALVLSAVIFMNQLLPIGLTLWIQVTGWKIVVVSPVMAVLAFMFFVIVYSIVGGVLMAGLLALFSALGFLLNFSGMVMGGKNELTSSIKASLYASAITLVMILPMLFMILSRKGILDFTNFKIGYNIVYSFLVLYLYGIFAIAARKTQKIERWKAFTAALLPTAVLIILGIFVSIFVLHKMQKWVV